MPCNRLLPVFNFSVWFFMQISLTSASPFRVTVSGRVSADDLHLRGPLTLSCVCMYLLK